MTVVWLQYCRRIALLIVQTLPYLSPQSLNSGQQVWLEGLAAAADL